MKQSQFQQELAKKVAYLKAVTSEMKRHEVPTRAHVKRSGKGAFARQDLKELARHPSGLNMYTHAETGCRLATDLEQRRILRSSTNANTTTFRSGR